MCCIFLGLALLSLTTENTPPHSEAIASFYGMTSLYLDIINSLFYICISPLIAYKQGGDVCCIFLRVEHALPY